ncbi:oligopeptide transporter, OPT family [Bacteroidales bacterium OttesenSCG-928-B11]|nr:oligopeptide transporter, OPT family [Bacteroidales bacterium OttesenSCG-928-C03]MDL2311871.1 oligopeptide transporter, OPT family [Bacteroidales bacterium OttesenSCG-928-B11]MDL2326172.1 oligopeptide transporter, OPT family [Bacteroidales bacterium OttesenSCG-928-A14]
MKKIDYDEIPENEIQLPDNAYTELKEGEEYKPILMPDKQYPEINGWTIFWGLLMAVIFSAATAYSGLKFGQVFEAAIPIAIIAVGVSTVAKRKSALSENVIIQSIGASSGVIVAGAIFTLPAIYIIKETSPEIADQINVNFFQIFLASLFGGVLGILFLIPFRKYFVSDMHGKYPFPEATATTEIIVSGAKGGSQAKLLLISGAIGGLYDFLMTTFHAWSDTITTTVTGWGATLANKFKFVLELNAGAILLGTGFLIGLKYATIICAGSLLAWWVIVPLLGQYGVMPDGTLMSTLAPEVIFKDFVRYIGIGGIAMAGIIGVIKSAGVIKTSLGIAFKSGGKKSADGKISIKRTERDIPMKIILIGFAAVLVMLVLFFIFGLQLNFAKVVVAILIVFIFAFLFTTVAATAIATVGTNPVSGMTMMTLILSSFILSAVGLSGGAGIITALVVGGVVCSALAMAGGFITDLKIGYWIGTSPFKQQALKFAGTFVSALTVGAVIMLLSETYGYTGADALVAPQANAMAAIIKPLMFEGSTPWLLYIIGAILAILLDRIGIPALAFSLGIFLPLSLNIPLLVGGFIAWFISSRSKDEAVNKARKEKGTLLASGLLAGGAIMGVVSAIMRYSGFDFDANEWVGTNGFYILGVVMYLGLCIYLIAHSMKVKTTKE